MTGAIGPLQVVLCDDEPWICRSLAKMIGELGLPLVVASECRKADEALEYLGANHVDILITDIRMPGRDGLELVDMAKAIHPALQALVVSGYDEFP